MLTPFLRSLEENSAEQYVTTDKQNILDRIYALLLGTKCVTNTFTDRKICVLKTVMPLPGQKLQVN